VFVVQQPAAQSITISWALIMIEALRRGFGATDHGGDTVFRLLAQEKKSVGREPITGKLVANLITVAGANRVLTARTCIPRRSRVFSTYPVDHLRSANVMVAHCKQMKLDDAVSCHRILAACSVRTIFGAAPARRGNHRQAAPGAGMSPR